MIDVKKILYEITDDEKVFSENIDLIESGLLDSYAFIELFSKLEEENIILYPTRIDRDKLRTVKGIEELIQEYVEKKQ